MQNGLQIGAAEAVGLAAGSAGVCVARAEADAVAGDASLGPDIAPSDRQLRLLGSRANVLSAPWLDRMAKSLVAEIGRVQMSDCVFEASPHAFMDTFASTSVRTDLALLSGSGAGACLNPVAAVLGLALNYLRRQRQGSPSPHALTTVKPPAREPFNDGRGWPAGPGAQLFSFNNSSLVTLSPHPFLNAPIPNHQLDRFPNFARPGRRISIITPHPARLYRHLHRKALGTVTCPAPGLILLRAPAHACSLINSSSGPVSKPYTLDML